MRPSHLPIAARGQPRTDNGLALFRTWPYWLTILLTPEFLKPMATTGNLPMAAAAGGGARFLLLLSGEHFKVAETALNLDFDSDGILIQQNVCLQMEL
jgi:hypothetical protein